MVFCGEVDVRKKGCLVATSEISQCLKPFFRALKVTGATHHAFLNWGLCKNIFGTSETESKATAIMAASTTDKPDLVS